MNKPLNWFEIPTINLDKSRSFYERVFRITMKTAEMGPAKMAVFPYDRDMTVGGALMEGPGLAPGSGPILYLNAGAELDNVLERALQGGAQLAVPRTALPPGMGFFAQIMDLDGNKIGLHGIQ